MSEHGATFLLAQGAGLVGLAGRVAWPALTSRTGMLTAQALISLSFTAHFALLGVVTAALVSLMSSLQALAMLTPLQRRCPRGVTGAAILGMVVMMLVSWDGIASLLVTAGLATIAQARSLSDAGRMARLLTAGQVIMLAHDLMVFSPVAILADLAGLGMRGVAVLRTRRAAPAHGAVLAAGMAPRPAG